MGLTRSLGLVTVASALVIACGSSGKNADDGSFGDGADSGANASGGDNGTGGDNGNGGFGNGGGSSDGGALDASCAATVAQTEKAKVDIIFVIDDSGSMTEEMNQIKVNVNTFAQKIGSSGLDYQVIFIVKKAKSSTQTGNVICVPAPLGGASCADNPPLFHHIDQDVQSHNAFDLILSTYDDTKNPALAWNTDLRPDSYKVFVVVSDDEADLTYDKFDTQLLAKQPAGMFGTAAARKYIWHSICGWTTGQPVPSTQKCSTAVAPGSNYQNLSKLTGGIVDSVCNVDYSGVLNNMAKGITDKLGCQLAVPSSATSDPTKVVVQEVPPMGSATDLTQVTDVSKCTSIMNGWYYDNATTPTQIILCPDTCTAANTVAGTKIQAAVGCAAPPPK